jgi:hypothetical protein
VVAVGRVAFPAGVALWACRIRRNKKGDFMTIGNALGFIERGLHDTDLRKRLNTAATVQECERLLGDEDLNFSPHDFDEAFHHRLTQCQEAEEAEQIKEFKMWWDLLRGTFGTGGCGTGCSGCC